MSRSDDIQRAIAEQASSLDERRALGQMADRLEDALGHDVPYRPAFRESLRQELLAAARKRLVPWYRRPAFLGSGVAVTAAALVFAVGLRMLQQEPSAPMTPPGQGSEVVDKGATPPPSPPVPSNPDATLVSSEKLPQTQLADETVVAQARPVTVQAEEAPSRVSVRRLTARPTLDDARALASRLSFRGEGRRSADLVFDVEEGARSLTVAQDGRVTYFEPATGQQETVAMDADGARAVARRFLDRALLPVPGQTAVDQQSDRFVVTYTDQVDGRPIVNGRTVIEVTQQGEVVKAQAFLASGVETVGSYSIISASEAIQIARDRGGTFEAADLVWARTPSTEAVFLQPYWRVYGPAVGERRTVRYVPAVKK